MSDRRVHAEGGEAQIVRYDRAGKWVLEWVPSSIRPYRRLTLQEAVEYALILRKVGGTIHLGLPGGTQFDARVRREDAQ